MSHPSFREKYGPWALVAGASSGLGEEFATQLAARGLNLVLFARRGDVLAELAARLGAAHHVEVRVEALDLGAPDLLLRTRAALEGLDVGLLVYNAALSLIGPFLSQSLEDKLRVIDVNCRGPLVLSDELGRRMVARGRGGILLMSSLSGSRGGPLVATYAATKAYSLVLAEGLWEELRSSGVDVLACRAGATRTAAYEATKPQGRVPVMERAPVVTEALDALGSAPSMVPGLFNGFGEFVLARLLPRSAAVKLMGRATRSLYPKR